MVLSELEVRVVQKAPFEVDPLWEQSLVTRDCIFCEPNGTRVILESSNFCVMAGAGPIVPGYVMLFPKQHEAMMSALAPHLHNEFLHMDAMVCELLQMTYRGGGVTAYEHGKTGACLRSSHREGASHCFHAHRLYIPAVVEVQEYIEPHFQQRIALPTQSSLWEKVHEPYVYFRTGDAASKADAFVGGRAIPSQFVRRLLARAVGRPEQWDWAKFPKWDSVADTVARLRATATTYFPSL